MCRNTTVVTAPIIDDSFYGVKNASTATGQPASTPSASRSSVRTLSSGSGGSTTGTVSRSASVTTISGYNDTSDRIVVGSGSPGTISRSDESNDSSLHGEDGCCSQTDADASIQSDAGLRQTSGPVSDPATELKTHEVLESYGAVNTSKNADCATDLSPSTLKIYNPFPRRHHSDYRSKNGVRLRLYSLTNESSPSSPVGHWTARRRRSQDDELHSRQRNDICLREMAAASK